MQKILFSLCLALAMQTGFGQSTEDSVKTAVNELFRAMKTSDGTALAAAFADHAILQTISTDAQGIVTIRDEAIADFVKTIGEIQPGDADERIRFESILVDGDLASVWTPYSFYYKGNFSHCGVNSFQLVRIQGAWKIQYIIDTRRKACD